MPSRLDCDAFVNPNGRTLSELSFSITQDGGYQRSIPALNKHWLRREHFAQYTSLHQVNGHIKQEAELAEWKHNAAKFRDDILYLLTCRQHEFWSYMIYQKSALAAIISFLQNSTPFYLYDFMTGDEPALALYEEILNFVVRVIYRLLTNKESKECYVSDADMGKLIYSNFLISVPMLCDLVVALGNSDKENSAILQHIFDKLLIIAPEYAHDLATGLAFFRSAFRSIQTQAENEGCEGAGSGPIAEHMETPYDDVVLYNLDCAYTLSVLLDVSPKVCEIAHNNKMGESIAQFYSQTIPFLYTNIFQINSNASSLKLLNQSRQQYLNAFRSIATSRVDAALKNPAESILPAAQYVALLTKCLSEQLFVVDYQALYPLERDVGILKQACKELDNLEVGFVLKGYKKEAESLASGSIGNLKTLKDTIEEKQAKNLAKQVKLNLEASSSKSAAIKNGSAVHAPAAAAPLPARNIDDEVAFLLEMFPDYGSGYVRDILQFYNNSQEALQAILDNNLPPKLWSADKTKPYIPPDPQNKLYSETGIKRYNVFDGDKYDIMTQENPACIIKQGKGFPNAPQDAAQLLNDKSDLEKVRHRYQEYTMVTQLENEEKNEYSDEYDDSYDALLESERRVVLPKELKAGLANVADVSEESEEDTDNDEPNVTDSTNTAQLKNRFEFCENPEAQRARYEANRQAKAANRGGGAARQDNKNWRQTQDVVGNAKGQGQSKETVRSRNNKEVNKSQRANHNRKSGAAFKRSKGMMG